uniref:Urokinase plasminogen activator surface receptor n=1 Tax=Canis lupus familiaris TaxID=9615 RepID=A0A8C0LSP2_CANLF
MGLSPGNLLLPLPMSLALFSWSLQCMLCGSTGKCQVEECTPGQDLCRTTIMRIWEDGDELEVVERGCTHPEKSNRTMSYRTGMKIITLTEAVCGTNLCNKPTSGRVSTFPRTRSRYLECVSCGSSDLSCERGLDQSLQCRSPTEQCVEVVTHRGLEGELFLPAAPPPCFVPPQSRKSFYCHQEPRYLHVACILASILKIASLSKMHQSSRPHVQVPGRGKRKRDKKWAPLLL